MAQLPAIIRRPLEMGGFLSPLAIPVAEGDAIGPVAEASPESDDAQPSLRNMISRSGEANWIPEQWLNVIAQNTDTILARDGTGLGLYAELADDDIAFSAMQQRRLAITSEDWEVTAGDDADPRSVKAADEFRAMIEAVGIDRVTGLLHWGVWYGYAVGECLFTTKPFDGREIVWLDGVIVPDRRHFGFTLTGQLRFKPPTSLSIGGEVLPDNKFFTIRTGGTHDFAFYGLGLAHWAYWPIFFKRSALKFWALYLEKFGQPTVAIGFPPEEKDDTKKLAARLDAAIAVGKDSAVLVPNETLEKNLIKIMESTRSGTGASSYKDFVDTQDDALLRIILGQPGTSKATPGGLGGDGQATKDEGVKRELVKADSDLISEAINRGPATWLTRWNHGPDVAPPKFYRLLDDEEDISTTAKRDVDLDGIGWQRTEDSFKSTYGDGYERKPEPDPSTLGGAVPGAGGNVVDIKKARVAKAALAFGVEDRESLYVSRKLLNEGEVRAWATKAGFKSLVPGGDMHVTVLYSKTPVDWFAMGEAWGEKDGGIAVIPGGPRSVEAFGDGAVVLRFYSNDLRWRHETMIERGASSDYDEYKPHITISYDAGDVDLDKVEPYTGELRFGPEIFEPIKEEALDPAQFAFGAAEEEGIDRLIRALSEEANPVFEAMGDALRESLQGVTTVEGARIAILGAMENLPVERMARLSGLPMLAARSTAAIGREGAIDA